MIRPKIKVDSSLKKTNPDQSYSESIMFDVTTGVLENIVNVTVSDNIASFFPLDVNCNIVYKANSYYDPLDWFDLDDAQYEGLYKDITNQDILKDIREVHTAIMNNEYDIVDSFDY